MTEEPLCPLCGALPADQTHPEHVKNPENTLLMILYEIRTALGVGHKPMLSELPSIISSKIEAARLLDNAVSEFLDANSAWNEDEISEDDYAETMQELQNQLYSTRAVLNGTDDT